MLSIVYWSLLVLTASTVSVIGQLAIAQSNSTSHDTNATSNQPKVIFPSQSEMINYLKQQSVYNDKFNNISSPDQGIPSKITTAVSGNSSYVTWLGNINNTNHVFLALSHNKGLNYSKPVELSSKSPSLNASNLKIAASKDSVYIVWQGTNTTNNVSSIFASTSMNNGGKEFRTYKADIGNTNATDPVVDENGIFYWIQENPCGGSLGHGPPRVVCGHGGW